jgi:hypothetical protein
VDEHDRGLHRRDLIKKAAVAGGIVWATPVIQSMTSAAAAAGTPNPACSAFLCGELTFCPGRQDQCVQDQTLEGACICVSIETECGPPCSSSADCGPGSACIPGGCCDTHFCVPLVCEPTAGQRAAPGVKTYASR